MEEEGAGWPRLPAPGCVVEGDVGEGADGPAAREQPVPQGPHPVVTEPGALPAGTNGGRRGWVWCGFFEERCFLKIKGKNSSKT